MQRAKKVHRNQPSPAEVRADSFLLGAYMHAVAFGIAVRWAFHTLAGKAVLQQPMVQGWAYGEIRPTFSQTA